MTALAEALKVAGYPRDDLRKVAVDALTKNADNWDAAKYAMLDAVRNDAALLWQLFEPYRALAVHKLLTQVAAEMREAAQAGRDQRKLDDQSRAAPAGSRDARPNGRAGEAGPGVTRKPVMNRPASPPSTAGMGAVAATARLSVLNTFRRIGDTPIGELTPNQANSSARNNERDARFVRILTANIPPNDLIGKWRTPDEADAAWKQAVGEMANAA